MKTFDEWIQETVLRQSSIRKGFGNIGSAEIDHDDEMDTQARNDRYKWSGECKCGKDKNAGETCCAACKTALLKKGK